MPLHRLRSVVQHYDWGSHTVIPELLGQDTPSERPCAELWIGAHAAAPSDIEVDGAWRSLREWIAERPGERLGERVCRRFGAELPLLLKVLAIEQPLSLQAHPDAAQARAGFARETQAGVAPAQRSYVDPHGKPELVCAVAPFEALCGFRPLEESRALASRLALPALDAVLSAATPGAALARLLRLAPRERGALVDAVIESLPDAPKETPFAWVRRLAEAHPGDPGALAPLLLHCVELAPGDGLYLRPRSLHTYLGGVAVEVLANSDNVLRGGLTRKRVAVDELLSILDPEASPPARVRGEPGAGGTCVYTAPVDEFALAVLQPRPDAPVACASSAGPELLLCLEGEAEAAADAAARGQRFERGAALFVPASQPGFHLRGRATVYRAFVPEAGAGEGW